MAVRAISAETLRTAAALMRERATHVSVPHTRWYVEDDGHEFNVLAPDPDMPGWPWDVTRNVTARRSDSSHSPVADHIASWHPAVALAVADWLDVTADTHDDPYYRENHDDLLRPALAVARAYLGESND